MKNNFLKGALVAIVLLQAVGMNAIDIIAYKKDSTSKWCFMDEKGHTYLENRFEGEIIGLYDGVFYERNKSDMLHSVYEFDKKNPRLIIDKIFDYGYCSEGVFAVTRGEYTPIEVLDKSGKSLFTLDAVNGNVVTECHPCHYGRIPFATVDLHGKKRMGMVDMSGNVIVQPGDYQEIIPGENGAYIAQRGNHITHIDNFIVHDGKGNSTEYKGYSYIADGYIVMVMDDRTEIRKMDCTTTLLTLPASTEVYQIMGKYIAYRNAATLGVMSWSGKVIAYANEIEENAGWVVMTNQGFLIWSNYDQYDLYSKSGKHLNDRTKMRKTGNTYWCSFQRYSNAYFSGYECDPNGEEADLDNTYLMNADLKVIAVSPSGDWRIPDNTSFNYCHSRQYAYRLQPDRNVSIIMVNYLEEMVKGGAIAGKKESECTMKMIDSDVDQKRNINSEIKVDSTGIIKSAHLNFRIYSLDDMEYLPSLYEEVCKEMESRFSKVEDGLYEHNGVYFKCMDNGTISLTDKKP